jgi:hypothetical protein
MPDNSERNNLLLQYAGVATQLMVSLALAIYAGNWVDKKISLRFPLFLWVLPLIVLIALFIKVLKDTSKK